MANKKPSLANVEAALLAPGFGRKPAESATLPADPVVEVAMVADIEKIRPFDTNPRTKRNPLYDEIKQSIRDRGLDSPPAITRRPGEAHYIIANGGNTRLSILHELYGETKDQKFRFINVLFRPWKGEISALTGHLAENDLRGNLTFLERALGIDQARQLYEQAGGATLSQRELSKRLKADGYQISNSQISRMQDTIRFLMPALPNVLFAGLGIDPSVRLIGLYKAANAAWDKHKSESMFQPFHELFVETLNNFDDPSVPHDFKRVLDELTGQMSEALGVGYDMLSLEIVEASANKRGDDSGLLPVPVATNIELPVNEAVSAGEGQASSTPAAAAANEPAEETLDGRSDAPQLPESSPGSNPSAPSNKPKSKEKPNLEPRPAPEPEVWTISPQEENASSLRNHIAQLARDIVVSSGLPDHVEEVQRGIGFHYVRPWGDQDPHLEVVASSTLMLLESLIAAFATIENSQNTLEGIPRTDGLFAAQLGHLLLGTPADVGGVAASPSDRLSDAAVIKLFRVIRLARRLIDLEMESRLGE